MNKYHDDADGNALARIAADGVDMSKARLIEFAINVSNESSAKDILRTLIENGYDSEIYYDEGELDGNEDDSDEFGPSWTVYANIKMVPEYDEIIKIQAELDRLAKPHGGYSDGWGTMVE